MLRRIEADEQAGALVELSATRAEAIVPAVAQAELEMGSLPPDHPRWLRDALAVSQRAREIIAKLEPIVVRVLGFWDHHLRSIRIGEHRVGVDVSGCYRIES